MVVTEAQCSILFESGPVLAIVKTKGPVCCTSKSNEKLKMQILKAYPQNEILVFHGFPKNALPSSTIMILRSRTCHFRNKFHIKRNPAPGNHLVRQKCSFRVSHCKRKDATLPPAHSRLVCILWNLVPLNHNILPHFPRPYSPVHNPRKFSHVFGQISPRSCNNKRRTRNRLSSFPPFSSHQKGNAPSWKATDSYIKVN